MRGFGWGFFWGDSFFGSTRSSSEHSDFLGMVDFGSTRSSSEHSDFLRVGILGVLGATRSSSEHSDFEDGDFLGLFLIGSVGFSGLRHLFSDAALL